MTRNAVRAVGTHHSVISTGEFLRHFTELGAGTCCPSGPVNRHHQADCAAVCSSIGPFRSQAHRRRASLAVPRPCGDA